MDVNKEILKLDWEREPKGLYAPIAYTLAAGGKRVRPQLAMIGSQLFGGKDEEVLPAALALEVFHNFTLLHDDIMDKADIRRGKPTVHIKWNENTSILSGDGMLIKAYQLLAEYKGENFREILDLFSQTALEVCEGQQYDMEFENRNDVKEEEYIEMIRLKTAVLLAASLKIGALSGGATTTEAQALYAFGINIGLAFQLKDDLLDVYGDEATFGKNIGGDICCNKKTYLLINALNGVEGAEKESLNSWITKEKFDRAEKVAAVTNIYNQLNLKEKTEKVLLFMMRLLMRAFLRKMQFYTFIKNIDKIKRGYSNPYNDIIDALKYFINFRKEQSIYKINDSDTLDDLIEFDVLNDSTLRMKTKTFDIIFKNNEQELVLDYQNFEINYNGIIYTQNNFNDIGVYIIRK